MEFITLPDLPPVAPYSHAVRAGDFLFVTGQLAEDPQTGIVQRGSIAEQTHHVMANLKKVLAGAGSSLSQVVSVRIFLTDMREYDEVNAIYASYFPAGRLPCRTTIGSITLAGLGDVEIDLIAYCGE